MTKEKRLVHYHFVREIYKDIPDNIYGMCFYFHEYFSNSTYGKGEMKKYYPELRLQKPRKAKDIGYWWDIGDNESRIKALDAAIKLCEKE